MSASAGQNTALTVLLIEDNADDALLVGEMLAEAVGVQFRTEEAGSLQAGLNRLQQGEIDLVLLDLSLPDSFGLSTLARLRDAFPAVPVVIMTGLAEESLGLEAVRCGAQDYLPKGHLSPPLMTRTLRYAIERHHSQQELRRREEHLRLLTDQLPALFWTTDLQLEFTSSLGAGLMGMKLRPDALIGKTLFDFFQTNDPEYYPIQAHYRALQGESVSYEVKWTDRLYQAHVEPMRSTDGLIIGTIGIALDMTEQRRIAQEFRLAQEVQRALLPKSPPDLPGFEIAGACHPASETGGDFFDYIPLADSTLAIVIGDVSGHGMGPAILTAATRSYIRALTRMHVDVSLILEITNKLLHHDTLEEHFVTALLARLEPRERLLTFSNAGHPAALVMDRHGDVRAKLAATGAPLGFDTDFQFGTETVALSPGDLVFFYSDGLTEAMAANNDMFGPSRTIDLLREWRYAPCTRILEAIHRRVHDFCATPHLKDDMTCVVVKVLG